jgi:ADP-heptose:LPS heptosyltransferase
MYKFVNRKTKLIVLVLDIAGFLLWTLVRILTPWRFFRRPDDSPAKVLLIRCDYIGDVFLTTHTLKGIRKRFPESRITFLVSSKSKEVLEGNPYIDELIIYDPPWFFNKCLRDSLREYFLVLSRIRAERFDLAVDFRGDVRNIFLFMVFGGIRERVSFSASGGGYLLTKRVSYTPSRHESEYHTDIARALGAVVDNNELPKIYISESDRQLIIEFIHQNNLDGSKIAIIQPGARKDLRLWPIDRYAEVCRFLIEHFGASIVLTGSVDEMPLLVKIRDLLGGNTVVGGGSIDKLKKLAALFERSFLYLGVSSGASHIAASMGIPSLLIFGPETAEQWRPIGNRYVIVKKEFPCSPCNQRKNCPILDRNCIKAVETADVLAGIKSLLADIDIQNEVIVRPK